MIAAVIDVDDIDSNLQVLKDRVGLMMSIILLFVQSYWKRFCRAATTKRVGIVIVL
jgi:hypothetical protein